MSQSKNKLSPKQILDEEGSSSNLKNAARRQFEIRKEDEIIVVEVDSFIVEERIEL